MSKMLAIVLVILSTLFWGGNFNAGKYIVEYLPPFVAASLRFSLASVFILLILVCTEKNIIDTLKRNWKAFIVLGLIGVAGFNGLFFLGLKYTTAVNGALIMATNPLVTMLLAALILNQTINARQWIGLVFSFFGVLLVITHGSLDTLIHLKIASGDWIILAANFCWALYSVLNRHYIKSSTPMITTSITMCVGTLVLLLFSAPSFTEANVFHHSWQVNVLLCYMAIFGSVLAYLFWNHGIERLGASETSIFFNLVPVFTVAISLLIGQSVALLQIVGGLLVIMGVLISSNVIRIPGLRE